jgi:inorganic pyrophosphatase
LRIIVETPKWSFKKIEKTGNGFERAFFSPIPTPFNYGFIEKTVGGDKMPLDVIVLGERLKSDSTLDLCLIGRVNFIDDDRRDDKYIATLDGSRRKRVIWLFFTLYALAKLFLGILRHGRLTKNRFIGVEWFEKEIEAIEDIPA